MEFILGLIVFIVVFIILPSLKQINEYERGVKFTLGKYSKMMNQDGVWFSQSSKATRK